MSSLGVRDVEITDGVRMRSGRDEAASAVPSAGFPFSVAILAAAAYYVGGRLGLELALVEPTVTPLWPPTGIAVAVMLFAGRRIWPAIALAAFLLNLPLGPSVSVAAVIAAGNTIAPLVAVTALRRMGVGAELATLRDALGIVFVAGLGVMGISATIGSLALLVSGVITSDAFAATWSVWWAGDAMGVLAFAPLILAVRASMPRWTNGRIAEGIAMLMAGGVVASLVLHSQLRLLYLIFPFLGWAALRFEQLGATAMAVVVTITATHTAAMQTGAFSSSSLLENMVMLQVFNAGVTSMGLVLASVVSERRAATEQLRRSGEVLEERVHQRTAELEEANARLRELDELKDAFLTAVSHEMRTPLTVVRGVAETLKRPEVQSDGRTFGLLVERLGANAERLEGLLRDLLDLDRLKRGVMDPQRRPTDVRALAATVIGHIDAPEHEIVLHAGSAIAPIDPAQVERIVENLVMNAVKHTPPGTPIWVRAERDVGGVTILVEDAGPGVPAQRREQIFEAFVRGDPAEYSPGTGVGLALVERFARAHGGRAWVEERAGGGASFGVRLPDPPTERGPRAIAS